MFHLGCEFGKGLCHAICALGKGSKLKHAHGSIPDDGLGISQGPLEGLQGVGANVQSLQAALTSADCLIVGMNEPSSSSTGACL